MFDRCSPETVRIGTVCMMTSPYPLEKDDIGKNDFFFATQTCAELGGYLPTAAQLIGAAPRVKLAGRVDDNEVTASTDVDADRRPQGPARDERDPDHDRLRRPGGGLARASAKARAAIRRRASPTRRPLPADPAPETLQYITVYDNGDHGGFAGGKPVGQPENFRCAFNRAQGNAGEPWIS